MEPDHCPYGLTDYSGSCIGHTLENLKQSFWWENRIRGGAHFAEFSGRPAKLTLKLYFKANISSIVDQELCLALQLPVELPPIGTCLSIFRTHLNLSTITSVDVRTELLPADMLTEVWATITRLPNLKTLLISGPDAGVLQRNIKQWEAQLRSSTAPDPCFPSLSNLTLLGVEIAGRDDKGSPTSLILQLVTVLKAQAATGNSISQLRIQDCWHFSQADYSFARGILPGIEIEWDRHGGRHEPVDYLKVDIGWKLRWDEGI